MSQSDHPLADTLLARLVDVHALRTPTREALVVGSTQISFGELSLLIDGTRRRLAALGLGPGERALIVMQNSAELVVALLAVTALGAIAVPVDVHASAERLEHVVETMQPRVCLYAEGLPPAVPVLTVRLSCDPDLAAMVEARDHAPPFDLMAGPSPDETAFVLLSSGSTGRPKGVKLKHRQLLATARSLSTLFGIEPDHRELVLSPICHSDGWQRVAATWLVGGCVVLPTGMLSIAAILDDMRRHEVKGLFTPPPLIRYMLAASEDRVLAATQTVRTLEIGSAPLASSELRRVIQLFPAARVFFHYGLTECSRAVVLDGREHPDKLHTVGVPSPGVELALVSDAWTRVGPGRVGQILVRGPQRTDGYWNGAALEVEKLVEALPGELPARVGPWLATGDYGVLDDDGFLTLLGRRDDMITSGGYHFFPAEVEAELGPVEGVLDYVVAGVQDDRGVLEQVPWAFVVPADGSRYRSQDFLRRARARLPAYMVPRRVITVAALPLTPSGKPDRRRAVALWNAAPLAPPAGAFDSLGGECP